MFIFAFSWASGALDPESTSSGDLVSSVKRYAIFIGTSSLFFCFSFAYGVFLLFLNMKVTFDAYACFFFNRGVWAMIAVFLAYCLLQAPST